MKLFVTVPDNFSVDKPIDFDLAGNTFHFFRNNLGEGLWYSSHAVGTIPPHCALPFMIQNDISQLAKEYGLSEQHNFAHYPPKEEKKTISSSPRKEAKKKKTALTSFNPFKM